MKPASDKVTRGRRKPAKQRRAWCRGKIGREHQLRWRLVRKYVTRDGSESMFEQACTECGKQIKFVWAPAWDEERNAKYRALCDE